MPLAVTLFIAISVLIQTFLRVVRVPCQQYIKCRVIVIDYQITKCTQTEAGKTAKVEKKANKLGLEQRVNTSGE